MIQLDDEPNLYMENSCLAKHPLKNGRSECQKIIPCSIQLKRRQGRFGPLGNAKLCRDTRKSRLESYVRPEWMAGCGDCSQNWQLPWVYPWWELNLSTLWMITPTLLNYWLTVLPNDHENPLFVSCRVFIYHLLYSSNLFIGICVVKSATFSSKHRFCLNTYTNLDSEQRKVPELIDRERKNSISRNKFPHLSLSWLGWPGCPKLINFSGR